MSPRRRHYHVAVIPDGNRRYLSQTQGGANASSSIAPSLRAFRELLEFCGDSEEVSHLSVFCWSSENWRRPETEVQAAMQHLHEFLCSVESDANTRYACCSSSPRLLSTEICEEMSRINGAYFAAEAAGGRRPSLCVYLYISYGFAEHMSRMQARGGDESFDLGRMDAGIPQVDCLVRTSGEQRLSNFCMHKLSFAELVFVDKLFPECTRATWQECMSEFAARSRRFGR